MGILTNFTQLETNMKKKLAMIVALILSILMCFSVFGGCNILTTNNDKDMKQVVAEVNVTEDGSKVKKITKKDMIVAYLNYGYYYAYYGYTQEQVFDMIVENLVGSEIMLQYIMEEYEANGKVVDSTKAKYSAERYLSAEELRDAEYDALLSINTLIDGYMDVDETYADTYGETVRAIPTGATNAEKDVDKDAYIAKGVYDVAVGEERHKAYNSAISGLKFNNLLGDYRSDIKETEYYKQLIVTCQETKLLETYSENYKDEFRKDATYQSVKDRYAEMYNAQKENNSTVTNFEESLSNATADKPIVYTPYGGYGYVYNLLLGASETQTTEITALKKELTNTAEFNLARKSVLQATIVKDLRSSWILSGYDFDYATSKFTGDYTFSDENSLAFQGKVNLVKEATDEDSAIYNVESLTEFGLDEFIAFMDDYVYADKKGEIQVESSTDVSIYRQVKAGNIATEYDEKINELLFAFSTDPGSLNTYKGYVINPVKDLGQTEQWVKEFADAGRKLLELGGNSYIVVASDYGYHVMFYSAICSASDSYPTLDAYLDSLGVDKPDGVTTWEEYFNHIVNNWKDYENSDFYLYKLAGLYINVDTAYSEHEQDIVNSFRYDDTKVKVYSERYANILG